MAYDRVRQRSGPPLVVGVMAFFLTAVGGSTFRGAHLPTYRAVDVMGVSLVAALALVGVVLLSRKSWSSVPLALLAAGVTATVSPWQIGFADLRNGQAAHRVDDAGRRSRPSADRSAGRPTTSSPMPC